MSSYFTPKTFAFLRDLAANNEREWFKAHQAEYERYVREPALDFIGDFDTHLARISPFFVADTRKVGGSLFRIQRDTRFAKDKTPYKENTGMQFRHQAAGDVHTPGFYLNIQPGECYMGAGLWRPATKDAYAIRAKIADAPTGWKRVTRGKRFTDVFTSTGDSLVRAPRGYDEDHPLIEDLKRKDFIASCRLTQAQVTSSEFLTEFTALCKTAVPFMRFLCDAVELPFDKEKT